MVSAGTESPTTTLEWAMPLVLNHPESINKALSEIETCCERGRLLDEQDLPIPKLKCMHNVVIETLRLFPTNGSPSCTTRLHESPDDCVVWVYGEQCCWRPCVDLVEA
ncbi:Cytochrome [Abeliophyllum distichum]|uniref:Cytochrome n=1 Tax=Abeliophyllum distichum TaxID=126358 RepID=A0ABD1SZX4_9LAMI